MIAIFMCAPQAIEGDKHADLPIVLSEFGGIAFSEEGGTWGYSRAADVEDFARRYERLMEAIHSIGLLSGFCYTQFTDTYQEANGLLFADRRPKIPIARLSAATRGVPPVPHAGLEIDDVQARADEA